MKANNTGVNFKDNQSITDAIDQLVLGDRSYKAMTQRILRAQRKLKTSVTDDQFKHYLDVEAATNERLGHMLLLVARWAFNEGKASR